MPVGDEGQNQGRRQIARGGRCTEKMAEGTVGHKGSAHLPSPVWDQDRSAWPSTHITVSRSDSLFWQKDQGLMT